MWNYITVQRYTVAPPYKHIHYHILLVHFVIARARVDAKSKTEAEENKNKTGFLFLSLTVLLKPSFFLRPQCYRYTYFLLSNTWLWLCVQRRAHKCKSTSCQASVEHSHSADLAHININEMDCMCLRPSAFAAFASSILLPVCFFSFFIFFCSSPIVLYRICIKHKICSNQHYLIRMGEKQCARNIRMNI